MGDSGVGPDLAPPPPHTHTLKNHKAGLLSNTGPDPLKNHKATKRAFNIEPTSVLDPLSPHSSTKKPLVRVGPPLTKLSGSAHET